MKLSKISTLVLLLSLGSTLQINPAEETDEKPHITYDALHYNSNENGKLVVVGADIFDPTTQKYITTYDPQVIAQLREQLNEKDAQAALANVPTQPN